MSSKPFKSIDLYLYTHGQWSNIDFRATDFGVQRHLAQRCFHSRPQAHCSPGKSVNDPHQVWVCQRPRGQGLRSSWRLYNSAEHLQGNPQCITNYHQEEPQRLWSSGGTHCSCSTGFHLHKKRPPFNSIWFLFSSKPAWMSGCVQDPLHHQRGQKSRAYPADQDQGHESMPGENLQRHGTCLCK